MRGDTTAGTTMLKIPNPHLHPGPLTIRCAIGPPTHVVTIYGDVANASINGRFLSVDVSEINTVRQ